MSHEQNLFAFSEKFPAGSQERAGLLAAATAIVRMRTALVEIRDLGREGMKPDHTEWVIFHDKISQIANEGINS